MGRCGPAVPFQSDLHAIYEVWLGGGKAIDCGPEIVRIDGVWDLSMLGAEREGIERRYQVLTNGAHVKDMHYIGPIVAREDGLFCLIQTRLTEAGSPDEFYPSRELPADGVLVVRTSALHDLEGRLAVPDPKADKPLGRRERTSLLVIIAALAELAKIDVTKPAKAGATIESQAALLGAELTSRAIQNHLKLIPEALGRDK
jgi:hypothetical protein